MIDNVSNLTKLNWNECWDLPIYEFFTYLSYSLIKTEREINAHKEAMKKWKK